MKGRPTTENGNPDALPHLTSTSVIHHPDHLPALAGRWGRPGETLFLCSAGCWGDRSRGSVRDDVTREGVTREPLGLLNCMEL